MAAKYETAVFGEKEGIERSQVFIFRRLELDQTKKIKKLTLALS